jgi:hypothetical protein
MKLTRRQILMASAGAAQLGLLGSFGLTGRRAAALDPNGPSRLLSIYVPGGYMPMNLFCPFDDAMIASEIPEMGDQLSESVFFTAGDVEDLAPADGGHAPIRIVRTWDPAMPSSRENGAGRRYLPLGYSYKEFALHEQLALVHGVDQNSVAHSAGHIASMCGIAGPTYRAPGFHAVVANALADRFPDRPLPCVALDARSVPAPLDLPARAAPVVAGAVSRVRSQFSDDPAINDWWRGLDDRMSRPAADFAGAPIENLDQTLLESYVAETARAYRGPNETTNTFLKKIHDSLQTVSKVLATDVVNVLESTPGVEHLPEDCTYGGMPVAGYNRFGFTFGLANGSDGGRYNEPFDFALRLMKADLSSAIHVYLPVFNHDTHSATGHASGFLNLRADFDAIGRLLGEMKQTRSPNRPERSLLEDTLVVVFSEFARTWWKRGDDHWQHTSVMFAGGGVGPNRQIGNYTSDRPGSGGYGVDVDIREEDGAMTRHPPKASDFVATIYRAMGLDWTDFFIPGGYGEILGVRAG